MAPLLLAAFGRDEVENESEYVRAYVGAILIAEGMLELRALRKVWTKEG